MLYNLLTIALVFVAVFLILLILLQQGKGADAGAAFGSGSSGTVFGAAGSGGFLSRLTWGLAFVFFVLALGMAYMARHTSTAPQSIVEQAQQTQSPAPGTAAPATPSPAPAAGTH
ncbi:MAG TPA: preprotein translocase subunit SecG [Gammaproteobacteria bacterium]|jgi:preprotein translocase subunit SecG|nr:preprotein translocase subunit SecG [Gammaproteobacteria bacterium]